MDNENTDVPVTDSTEAPARKRAPRRATKKSADAPVEVVTQDAPAAESAPESGDAPADGDAPAGRRTRGRGRGRTAATAAGDADAS